VVAGRVGLHVDGLLWLRLSAVRDVCECRVRLVAVTSVGGRGTNAIVCDCLQLPFGLVSRAVLFGRVQVLVEHPCQHFVGNTPRGASDLL
jgi:hypothetical protein